MGKFYSNRKLFILFTSLGVFHSLFTVFLFVTFSKNDLIDVFFIVFFGSLFLSFLLSYFLTNYNKKSKQILYRQLKIKTKELEKSLAIVDKYVIRTTTDTKGFITSANKAFCDVSGYTQEELLGKPHSIIRHPDMPKEAFKDLWETIKAGRRWEGEVKNRKKNGDAYWVKAYIEPFYNEKHELLGYCAIRQNITDKKMLEQLNNDLEKKISHEVEKNIKQLEQIQKEQLENVKLSSIGSLAAGITHEINTPLTYIKGDFEMMNYDIEDLEPSEIKTRMESDAAKIMDGIDRIANIIESMKEVSQVTSEQKDIVNIYSTIVTALTVSHNSFKQVTGVFLNDEEFDIGIDKNRYIYQVEVQKQRIEQVWIIIIKNAIDQLIYIDDFEKRRLSITLATQDDTLIIRFEDNGGGITEDILKNIFEPFVSKKEHGGIGIGLNIAKKIIEDQGGEIAAYNTEDGAIFEIKLKLIKG